MSQVPPSSQPPPLPPLPIAQPVEDAFVPVAAVVEYGSTGGYLVRRTPPGWLWWTSFIGTLFVAAASVLLFLALSVTQSMGWLMLGFLWLWLAGLVTLIALVLGIIYAAMAASNDFPPPASRRNAILAWALPGLNIVLLTLLTTGGLAIARAANLNFARGGFPATVPAPPAAPGSPTLQLTVTNPASSRIDSATIVLPNGARLPMGPIVAYGTQVRLIRLAGDGPLTIELARRDGQRWRQVIDPYVVAGTTHTPTMSLMLQPSSGTPLAAP